MKEKDQGKYPQSTIRKFRIVQPEGERNISREVDFHNIEGIEWQIKGHEKGTGCFKTKRRLPKTC